MTKSLAAVFIFSFITVIAATSQNVKFDRITKKDGLIHEHILSMHKDREGFMWIGTYGSIERYDGIDHRYYLSNMDRPTGIINYSFHCIYEDNNGGLWFGTQGGLTHYIPEVDTFVLYSYNKEDPTSISSDNVRSIVQDKQGTFWIGTYGGGLNKFIPGSGKFEHFRYDSVDKNSLPCDKINTLFVDSKNNIWIGTEGAGLVLFDKALNKFIEYRKDENSPTKLQSDIINCISEDKTGNLWIGTWDGGLSKYNPSLNSFETYKNNPNSQNSISNNTVRSLIVDKDGILWLATFGGGLNKFDPNTNEFTIFKNDPFNSSSLSHDLLWSLYEDNEGILWIGTFGAGICKYDRNKHKFAWYSEDRLSKNTLSSNNISSILIDNESNLWLGTLGNGLNYYNKEKKKYSCFLNVKNDRTSFIRSLFQDAHGRIWVGTDEGILLLNPSGKILRKYQHNPKRKNSITSNSIESICEDRYGNLWFGTWNDGIYILEKKEIEKNNTNQINFINYRNDPDNPSSLNWNIVWHIHMDHNGFMWIGTDKSLDKFNEKDKTFEHYDYKMVSTIWEENSGVMWLGTFGFGLYRFDPDAKNHTLYNESNGFPNTVFLGILGDKENNLWMASEDGLYKFDPKTKNITIYSENEGLQGNKFNFSAYSLGPNGEMAFGGNNGFNLFYPENIKTDSLQINMAITDFGLYNNSVSYEKAPYGKALLNKQLFMTDTIILSHHQNFISFEFKALCYSDAIKPIYSYMLSNFDKEWRKTSSIRGDATYTNLDPGTYKFIVKASDDKEICQGIPKNMIIIIKPAWHQTILFKIILIIASLTIIFLLFQFRVRQIRHRNVYLEKLVNERTNEIRKNNQELQKQADNLNQTNSLLKESKNQVEEQSEELKVANERLQEANATKDRFFSIIAHDLKNPFNSLLGFIELLKLNKDNWDKKKQEEIINIIDNSSKVIYNLLDNLLQWSRSQTDRLRLEPDYIPAIKIVNDTVDLLKENYIRKKIELKIDVPANILVYIDEDMLQIVFRNLFSNAIKFTRRGGVIEINCKITEGGLLWSVKDTGEGIPDMILKRLFNIDELTTRPGTDGETGTGLGLVICKEFVEKNDGTIEIESEENKGTTFTLRFKKYKIV